MLERKQFDEAILDLLLEEVDNCYDDSIPISVLLTKIKIHRNHDAIIEAWKEKMRRYYSPDSQEIGEVIADLKEQKCEAEAEEKRRKDAKLAEIIADARDDCN